MTTGYDVNMRKTKMTGEVIAVIPAAYRNRQGERYYMAYTLLDGWVELSPEYVTRQTKTTNLYSDDLKRAVDRNLGYVLNIVHRVYG
jgi:hypothetical protein